MKLKKIDITGFKSFLDKASIEFPPGISAIVGPNGCGKSNVIDAMRWVMGEQSVKQLRGKNMEDIIFAGANGKKPLNMAEVTLTLANDNGHAPEEFRDFSEISITRRLYRSGESAYLINRQPCRLKDIYNIFMGSGVGTRTFSIIQQGNIGAIIDAGPDDRRLFIEEAAGVTRYKFRKNEALRKVKATGQNLLRINDIIAEVNRQMAALKRQAKKAERFKTYQQRIRTLDTSLLTTHYDEFSRQLSHARSLLRELKDTDIGHVTRLKKIDAAIEQIKLKRHQKDQEIAAQKSVRFETQRKIDRTEADQAHLKSEIHRLGIETSELENARKSLKAKTENMGLEVTQVEAQNQKLQNDIKGIKKQIDDQRHQAKSLQIQLNDLNQDMEENKNRLMALVAEEARYKNIYQNASNTKETLKRRLTRIDEEVALARKKKTVTEQKLTGARKNLEQIKEDIHAYESQIADLKTALTSQSEELGAQVKQTQSLELERNQTRSQLSTYKKMAANFDWYRDGVKAIMQARTPETEPDSTKTQQEPKTTLNGVIGILADMIEPKPGYETALEAVLGEALQYILVDDQAAGAAAIDYLETSGAGRSGFIPIAAIKPVAGAENAKIPAEQRLLQHVTVNREFHSIAEAILGHVAVVPSMDDALAIFNRNGRVQTIVTQTGDVISHQGFLIGGSQNKLAGILAKKQEMKILAERNRQLNQDLEAAQKQQQEMEGSVRRLETELQQCIARKNETNEEAMEAEKALYKLNEDLKSALRHLEVVELEQEQLLGEESDLDDDITKYNQALARVTQQVHEAQAQTAEASERTSQLSSQLERYNQQVVDLKLQLTAYNTKLESGTQTLQRLKEFVRDSDLRLEQLQKEIVQKKEKRESSQRQIAAKEQALQDMYKNLRSLETGLAANESEYSDIDTDLHENDGQLAAIQSERQQILEKIRLLELDLSEKRIMRDNIAGKVQERYHISIAALRAQKAQQDETLQMTTDEMEKELERFRNKVANIGDVNLGAIKEYEELKERFDFLTEQRNDLEKAIEDLHKVIRKINRITQQRFMETYEKVNAKLKEVFPKLFEGGSARLELTEPNKPLETGVEYMVHPPGKKLTRMSLLSGGEKALSAIAFIFAIFLIRPASFCLLDEIDAPLDEANVIRFNNLMKIIGKQSQIIMITHNKRTMEFAETLFGVTMEQKGISKVVAVNFN